MIRLWLCGLFMFVLSKKKGRPLQSAIRESLEPGGGTGMNHPPGQIWLIATQNSSWMSPHYLNAFSRRTIGNKHKPYFLWFMVDGWCLNILWASMIDSFSFNYPLRNGRFLTCWGSHFARLNASFFGGLTLKPWIAMDFALAGGRHLGLQRFRGAQRRLRPGDSDLSTRGKAGFGGRAADGCA